MGKILIIDDEKQMLALLSRILELEGYEVYRTATCKAGLRQPADLPRVSARQQSADRPCRSRRVYRKCRKSALP